MMALAAPLIPVSGREAWEAYSVDHTEWIDESAWLKTTYVKHLDPLHGTIQDHEHDRRLQEGSTIPSEIWTWEGDKKVVVSAQSDDQLFAPLWQSSPADAGSVNVDLLSNPTIAQLYTAMDKTRQTVMSQGVKIGNLFDWMFDPYEKERKVLTNSKKKTRDCRRNHSHPRHCLTQRFAFFVGKTGGTTHVYHGTNVLKLYVANFRTRWLHDCLDIIPESFLAIAP